MHHATAWPVAGKPGDLVVRVGNDARTLRKHPHVQAMQVVGTPGLIGLALFARHVLHALADQRRCFRVQFQGLVECRRRALAGVVVGRGTNAAAAEDHIGRGKRPLQRRGDARAVVAHIVGIAQRQPARGQQFDDLGQMLVHALAGEDLVADDDEAEVGSHGSCGPEDGGAASAGGALVAMTGGAGTALAPASPPCSRSR